LFSFSLRSLRSFAAEFIFFCRELTVPIPWLSVFLRYLTFIKVTASGPKASVLIMIRQNRRAGMIECNKKDGGL